MRVCKDCGKEKELPEFANAGVIKGVQYYRYRCKKCYSKFKNIRRDKLRKWYHEYRKILKCTLCGNDDHRVMEHHHPNDDKLMAISDMVRAGFSITKIKVEIEKCKTYCANCHRIITYDEEKWYSKF